MATSYEGYLFAGGYVAQVDLSGKQHHFIKLDTSPSNLTEAMVTFCTTPTDVCIGVCGDKPVAGEAVQVWVGRTMNYIVAPSTVIQAGSLITSNNVGQGVPAVAGNRYYGIAKYDVASSLNLQESEFFWATGSVTVPVAP